VDTSTNRGRHVKTVIEQSRYSAQLLGCSLQGLGKGRVEGAHEARTVPTGISKGRPRPGNRGKITIDHSFWTKVPISKKGGERRRRGRDKGRG